MTTDRFGWLRVLAYVCLLFLGMLSVSAQAQTHSFCPTDGNCTWTGTAGWTGSGNTGTLTPGSGFTGHFLATAVPGLSTLSSANPISTASRYAGSGVTVSGNANATIYKPASGVWAFQSVTPGTAEVDAPVLQDFTIDLSTSGALGGVNWRGIGWGDVRNVKLIYPGTGNRDGILVDGQDNGLGIGTYYNNFYNVYGYMPSYTSGTQYLFRFINQANMQNIYGGGSRFVSNPMLFSSGNHIVVSGFSCEGAVTCFETTSSFSRGTFIANRLESDTNGYVIPLGSVYNTLIYPDFVSATNPIVNSDPSTNWMYNGTSGASYLFNGAASGQVASMAVGCGLTALAPTDGSRFCAPSGSTHALTLVAAGGSRGLAMQRVSGSTTFQIINDGADNMTLATTTSGKSMTFTTNGGAMAFTAAGGAAFSAGLSAATYSTATNCASAGGTCGSASAGRVSIAAAATTVTVATTAVTANSEIRVTRDNSLGTALSVTCNTQSSLVLGTPYVSARSAGTSFTVTSDVAPTTNPLCMSYSIIN